MGDVIAFPIRRDSTRCAVPVGVQYRTGGRSPTADDAAANLRSSCEGIGWLSGDVETERQLRLAWLGLVMADVARVAMMAGGFGGGGCNKSKQGQD